jgi:hypothetical protein
MWDCEKDWGWNGRKGRGEGKWPDKEGKVYILFREVDLVWGTRRKEIHKVQAMRQQNW